MEDIQEKLDAIQRTNSNVIDKAFQNIPEYNDLIFLILEKALKNRFEEKTKFFTDVCVANSLRDAQTQGPCPNLAKRKIKKI